MGTIETTNRNWICNCLIKIPASIAALLGFCYGLIYLALLMAVSPFLYLYKTCFVWLSGIPADINVICNKTDCFYYPIDKMEDAWDWVHKSEC
jgi:hypothetical protein